MKSNININENITIIITDERVCDEPTAYYGYNLEACLNAVNEDCQELWGEDAPQDLQYYIK